MATTDRHNRQVTVSAGQQPKIGAVEELIEKEDLLSKIIELIEVGDKRIVSELSKIMAEKGVMGPVESRILTYADASKTLQQTCAGQRLYQQEIKNAIRRGAIDPLLPIGTLLRVLDSRTDEIYLVPEKTPD